MTTDQKDDRDLTEFMQRIRRNDNLTTINGIIDAALDEERERIAAEIEGYLDTTQCTDPLCDLCALTRQLAVIVRAGGKK